jgi:hypothetical protein
MHAVLPSSASAFQVIGKGTGEWKQIWHPRLPNKDVIATLDRRTAPSLSAPFLSDDTEGREKLISRIRNRFAVVLHSLKSLRVEGRETNPARGRGDGVCDNMKMHICPVYSDVLKVLIDLRDSPV